jgi:hypothetical protein
VVILGDISRLKDFHTQPNHKIHSNPSRQTDMFFEVSACPEGARPPWYEVPKIKKRMLKDLKKSPCSGTSFFNHPNAIFPNMIEDNPLAECTVCSTIWTQVSYHE